MDSENELAILGMDVDLASSGVETEGGGMRRKSHLQLPFQQQQLGVGQQRTSPFHFNGTMTNGVVNGYGSGSELVMNNGHGMNGGVTYHDSNMPVGSGSGGDHFIAETGLIPDGITSTPTQQSWSGPNSARGNNPNALLQTQMVFPLSSPISPNLYQQQQQQQQQPYHQQAIRQYAQYAHQQFNQQQQFTQQSHYLQSEVQRQLIQLQQQQSQAEQQLNQFNFVQPHQQALYQNNFNQPNQFVNIPQPQNQRHQSIDGGSSTTSATSIPQMLVNGQQPVLQSTPSSANDERDSPAMKSDASEYSHPTVQLWKVPVQLNSGEKTWPIREVITPLNVTVTDLLNLTASITTFVSMTIGSEPPEVDAPGNQILADHHAIALVANATLEQQPMVDGIRVIEPNPLPLCLTISFDLGANVKSCTRLGCPRILIKKASRRACDQCQVHGSDLTVRQIRTLHLQQPILTPAGKQYIESQLQAIQAQGAIVDPLLATRLTTQLLTSTNVSSSLGQLLDKALHRIEHWKFDVDSQQVLLAFADEASAAQAQTNFDRLVRQHLSGVNNKKRSGRRGASKTTQPMTDQRIISPLSNDSLPSSLTNGTQLDSDSEAPTRTRTRSGGRGNGKTGGKVDATPTATTASANSSSRSSGGHPAIDQSKSHSGHSRSTSRSDLHALDTDDSFGGVADGHNDVISPNAPAASEEDVPAKPTPHYMFTTHMSPGLSANHCTYTVRMKSHFWKLEVRTLDPITGKPRSSLYKKIGKPNQQRGHGAEQPISAAGRILGLGRARRRSNKMDLDDEVDLDGDEEEPMPVPQVKTEPFTMPHVPPTVTTQAAAVTTSGSKQTGKRRHAQVSSSTPSANSTVIAPIVMKESVVSSTESSHAISPPSPPLTEGSAISSVSQVRHLNMKPTYNNEVSGAIWQSHNVPTQQHLAHVPVATSTIQNQVVVNGDDFARMKHHAVNATMQVRSTNGSTNGSTTSSNTSRTTPVLLIYRDRKQLHRDMASGYLGDAPSSDDDGDGNGSGGGNGHNHFNGGDNGHDQFPPPPDRDDNDRNDENESNKRRKVDTNYGRQQQATAPITTLSTVPLSSTTDSKAWLPLINRSTGPNRSVGSLPSRITPAPLTDAFLTRPGLRQPALQEEKSPHFDRDSQRFSTSSSDEKDSFERENEGSISSSLSLHSNSVGRSGLVGSRSQQPPTPVALGTTPINNSEVDDLQLAVQLELDDELEHSNEKSLKRHRLINEDEEKQQKDKLQEKMDLIEQIRLPSTSWFPEKYFGRSFWRILYGFGYGPIIGLSLLLLIGVVSFIFLGANLSAAGGLSASSSSSSLAPLYLFSHSSDAQSSSDFVTAREAMISNMVGTMAHTSSVFNLWSLQTTQPIVVAPSNTVQARTAQMHIMSQPPSIKTAKLASRLFDVAPYIDLIGNETILVNATVADESLTQLKNVSFVTDRCNEAVQASYALGSWLLYSNALSYRASLKPFGTVPQPISDSPATFCDRMDTSTGRLVLFRILCSSMGNTGKLHPYCIVPDEAGFGGENCHSIVQFLYSNNLTSIAFQWPTMDYTSSETEEMSKNHVVAFSDAYFREGDSLNTQCTYFSSTLQIHSSQHDLAEAATIQLDGAVLAVLLFGSVGMMVILIALVMTIAWGCQRMIRGKKANDLPPLSLNEKLIRSLRTPRAAYRPNDPSPKVLRSGSNTLVQPQTQPATFEFQPRLTPHTFTPQMSGGTMAQPYPPLTTTTILPLTPPRAVHPNPPITASSSHPIIIHTSSSERPSEIEMI